MFAYAEMSEQQLFTLYGIGIVLTVAPIVIGMAALLGYLRRGSGPVA